MGTGPDRRVHALDKDSCEKLWETEREANPGGIPAIYEVARSEHIMFFVAGSGAKETPNQSSSFPPFCVEHSLPTAAPRFARNRIAAW
jgi:hypothetical protein